MRLPNPFGNGLALLYLTNWRPDRFKIDTIELAGYPLYSVDEGILLIHLESDIGPELIDAIVNKAPQQFICLDSAFHGNDQLKTNAAKTFEAYNQGKESIDRIEFKTV